MDLAVYISELLGLHGEVNVPQIGYFAQTRTNGYYNKDENKFYPPGHDISFQPQYTDNDSLAQYISSKKNISLASSKYFIEKYTNELKQTVAERGVDIAGLGQLHTVNATLAFKPNEISTISDPSFFGFQPIQLHPLGERSAENLTVAESEVIKKETTEQEHVPVKEALEEILTDKNVTIPTVITEEEVVPEEEVYVDEEEKPRRGINVWVLLLILVTILSLALLAIYQYKPSVFDSFMKKKVAPVPVVVKPADTQKAAPADTSSKNAAKQDTAKPAAQQSVPVPQTIQQPVDTFATVHYDILGGAFKTQALAENVMAKYRKIGLEPRILRHAKGNFYKITLGTYFDKDEAQHKRDSILKVTRIKPIDIYLQPYLPKRK